MPALLETFSGDKKSVGAGPPVNICAVDVSASVVRLNATKKVKRTNRRLDNCEETIRLPLFKGTLGDGLGCRPTKIQSAATAFGERLRKQWVLREVDASTRG